MNEQVGPGQSCVYCQEDYGMHDADCKRPRIDSPEPLPLTDAELAELVRFEKLAGETHSAALYLNAPRLLAEVQEWRNLYRLRSETVQPEDERSDDWETVRDWAAVEPGEAASAILELREENERLRLRVLSAAGDDLCRLSQEEIKDLSFGKVQIPTKEEFLASCERFHQQIATTDGVLASCLTLAQMIAENERLTADVSRLKLALAERTAYDH